MPVNANLAFREFWHCSFFRCSRAGGRTEVLASVFSSNGLVWLGAGLCVTVLPLLGAGLFARGVLKMNFTALSGVLAGSVTDPPALAFRHEHGWLGRAHRRVCDSVSLDHAPAHHVRAGAGAHS